MSIDGAALSPAALLTRLNELGGRHGIGRLDLVENRFVGMKSRGIYETPGGTILLAAHRGIESITLDRGAAHLKDELMPRYAELIYNGFWFSPEREMLQAAIDHSQEHVEGSVRLKLYKGQASVVGRRSPKSLYSEAHVTFEDDAGAYDQKDAAGLHQDQRAAAEAARDPRPTLIRPVGGARKGAHRANSSCKSAGAGFAGSRFHGAYRMGRYLVAIFLVFAATGRREGRNAADAIFAGGCFWCIEADFDKVPGVVDTLSGYTGGDLENPSYEAVTLEDTGHYEAVRITFDADQVTYEQLLHVFWRSVDPTDAGGQFCDRGPSYRTAVFVLDADQAAQAEASRKPSRGAAGAGDRDADRRGANLLAGRGLPSGLPREEPAALQPSIARAADATHGCASSGDRMR